jgi:hypothetical protein
MDTKPEGPPPLGDTPPVAGGMRSTKPERRPTRPEQAGAMVGALGLTPDEMIQGRYRLLAGPIGTTGGEAEVYQCADELRNETVALKLYYRMNARPKAAVLAKLQGLDHPHIVRIRDHFFWRDRFCEVLDFCAGGTIETSAPISAPSLRGFLEQLLDGLNYCHSQGIVHRDIKPSNLLFRDAAKTELLLADFGISSVLDSLDDTYRLSSTFARTIDYAAPELFPRKGGKVEISPKTDYYALGITLMHLLAGRSPFADAGYEQIVYAHATGELPKPATDDAAFLKLLQGLTQHKAENRWGFAQVQAWLRGQPILDDRGRPWSPQRPVGHGRPYPGFPQATTPQELAAHLHEFDAETALFRRNYIRDWLGTFDTTLAEAAAEIGETYTDRPELGLFKLKYLLDPTLPLQLDGLSAHTLQDLVPQIANAGHATEAPVAKLLWGGFLDTWIEAVRPVPNSQALSDAVRGIRKRFTLKDPLALFSLLYLLQPARPLELAPGVDITDPQQLEDALTKNPAALRGLQKLVATGHFEAWLRAKLGGTTRHPTLDAIRACREAGTDPALCAYVARWCTDPSVPLPFAGASVRSPKELVTLIERDAATREAGADLLARGWLRAWLVCTGQLRDPTQLDQLLAVSELSWQAKLESVLPLLDPTLPAPQLKVRPGDLRFGRISMGHSRRQKIRIANVGRGLLHGVAALENPDPAITLGPTRFEGNAAEVTVTVNPAHLAVGTNRKNRIAIRTNGGTLAIPLSYQVAVPYGRVFGRALWAGILASGALWIYRLFAGNFFFDGFENWMPQGRAPTPDLTVWLMLNPKLYPFDLRNPFWVFGHVVLISVVMALLLAGFAAMVFWGISQLMRWHRQK